ncbi:MAG: Maf family protein [Chromatiales bacterium]
MAEIYLASRSPRRRQLLEQIGVAHAALDVQVDERWDGEEPARAHVLRLALLKARRGWDIVRAQRAMPVLAADTAVVLDDQILGKAETREEAVTMLGRLAARSHWVYSGVALVDADAMEHSALSISRVCFRPLSSAEIASYCATGEAIGKAGGYAIQGLAAAFIERVEGSYSGVMGLPLFEAAGLLRAAGIAVP